MTKISRFLFVLRLHITEKLYHGNNVLSQASIGNSHPIYFNFINGYPLPPYAAHTGGAPSIKAVFKYKNQFLKILAQKF